MNELPLAVCFPRDDPGFAERVQILFDGPHFERRTMNSRQGISMAEKKT